MGILSGNPMKEPMHYGEVFGTWSYLMTTKGLNAANQTLINHAGDKDLKELLQEAIKLGQTEAKQIEALLKENAVALPPTPPDRAKANVDDIPVGARFGDMEIAAVLASNMTGGIISCSALMGQCIREDIGAMFAEFHLLRTALGLKILRVNKEKGWIIPPPLHEKV